MRNFYSLHHYLFEFDHYNRDVCLVHLIWALSIPDSAICLFKIPESEKNEFISENYSFKISRIIPQLSLALTSKKESTAFMLFSHCCYQLKVVHISLNSLSDVAYFWMRHASLYNSCMEDILVPSTNSSHTSIDVSGNIFRRLPATNSVVRPFNILMWKIGIKKIYTMCYKKLTKFFGSLWNLILFN